MHKKIWNFGSICKCPDGFIYDNKTGCKDLKPCSYNYKQKICPDAKVCYFSPENKTECSCPPFRKGRTCKILQDPCDETLRDKFNPDKPFQKCGNNACSIDRNNPTYGYKCDCPDGFVVSSLNKFGEDVGPHCSDIDECEVGTLDTEPCNGFVSLLMNIESFYAIYRVNFFKSPIGYL